MKRVNKTPELRFAEFCGDWEEKRLGEVCDMYLGLTYTPNYVETGVPFLSVKDITSGAIDLSKIKYISREEFDLSTKNSKPQKGDVLFGRVGSLGYPIVLEGDFEFCIFVSLGYLRMLSNDILNYYVAYWMKSDLFKKQIESKIAGSSQKNLNTGWLKEFRLTIPSLPEQTRIATFFTKLDEEIELTEKKLSLLEKRKKGYMQRIFSQEIRFLGENGEMYPEWEERRLGECCTIKKGKSFTSTELIVGDVPVIAGGKTPAYYHNVFTHDKGVITVSASGANAGYVGLHEGKIFASDCSVITNDNIEALKFIYQVMTFNQSQIYKLQIGGGQPHVYSKDIEKIQIGIPCFEEQQKISNFLFSLDIELDSYRKRLSLLKERKSGLMQRMFV